jgi:hypothetical protein
MQCPKRNPRNYLPEMRFKPAQNEEQGTEGIISSALTFFYAL